MLTLPTNHLFTLWPSLQNRLWINGQQIWHVLLWHSTDAPFRSRQLPQNQNVGVVPKLWGFVICSTADLAYPLGDPLALRTILALLSPTTTYECLNPHHLLTSLNLSLTTSLTPHKTSNIHTTSALNYFL